MLQRQTLCSFLTVNKKLVENPCKYPKGNGDSDELMLVFLFIPKENLFQ
jgi:hypothetical protein